MKLITKTALALAAVCLGLFALDRIRDQAYERQLASLLGISAVSSNDPIAIKMERFANQAVIDAWKRYRIKVHPGVHSIRAFEGYLDEVSKAPGFITSSESDKRAEGLIAGAFIGESIRLTHGGQWLEYAPGLTNAGPYVLKLPSGHSIWPVTWGLKRLINGPEDNIHHKYTLLVLKRTNEVSHTLSYWTNTPTGLVEMTNNPTK